MASPKTMKQVLAVIDKFGADTKVKSEEKRKLWDVLSALRGPDSNSESSLKGSLTCVIREHAVPRLAEKYAMLLLDNQGLCSERRFIYPSTHFTTHALKAFDALGLHWGKVNQ